MSDKKEQQQYTLQCFKKFHPLLVCAITFLIQTRFW